jgi:hypothetical protein
MAAIGLKLISNFLKIGELEDKSDLNEGTQFI